MSPDATIVIPSWNGKHHLTRCLPSLRDQTCRNFEVLVVDNGSCDGTKEFLTQHHHEVCCIALDKNYGFSRAVNEGIRRAHADLIILLNNDTQANPRWLEALLRAARHHPEASIFASKILAVTDRLTLDSAGDGYSRSGMAWNIGRGRPDSPLFGAPRWVFSACAAGALYRKNVFTEVGLLDEDFFAFYEDVDLGFRAQLLNRKCLYVPAAILYHDRGATIRSHEAALVYHCTRNALLTLIKNMPAALLVKNLPRILLAQVRHFGRHIVKKNHWKATLCGYASALKALPRTWAKRRHIQRTRTVSNAQLEDLFKSQEEFFNVIARSKVRDQLKSGVGVSRFPRCSRSPLRTLLALAVRGPSAIKAAVSDGSPGTRQRFSGGWAYLMPRAQSARATLCQRSMGTRSFSTLGNRDILYFDQMHPSQKIDVSVVIVHYHTEELLRACLANLLAGLNRTGQDPSCCEIFVINNGSDARQIEPIKNAYPQIRWISNAANAGFAKACNQGLRAARGKYCLLLNPDCFVSPSTIPRMKEIMDADPAIGLLGGRHVFPDGTLQPSCRRFPTLWNVLTDEWFLGRIFPRSAWWNRYKMGDFDHDQQRNVDQLMGSCLCIRRPILEQTGFLDERFFLYYEEVDLCWQAKKHGWKVVFDPDPALEVVHTGGASSSQNLSLRYQARYKSLCLWYRKNRPAPHIVPLKGIILAGLLLRLAAFGARAITGRPNAKSHLRACAAALKQWPRW